MLCGSAVALLTLTACGGEDAPQAEPPQASASESVEPDPEPDPLPAEPAAASPPSRAGRSPAELLLAEADALEHNGFWEDALASRDRALDSSGGLAEVVRLDAQLDQARLLLRLDRPLDAEQRLRGAAAAVERLPLDLGQRHALLRARAAIALDEPGPALDALGDYLELDGPARASVQLQRARLLELLGRVDEARRAADRAIADPSLPGLERRRAIWLTAAMLDAGGEAEAAIARYQEVIEAAPWADHPDIPAATARIAALSLELDDAAAAEQAWRRLIEEFPRRAEALAALEQLRSRELAVDPLTAGIVRYRHGQFDSARVLFITVLSDPPSSAEAAAAEYYVAAINEDLGELDGALLGYLAAIERDPGHVLAANAHWWAAQLLEQRGESGEALYRDLFSLHSGSEFAPAAAERHAWYAVGRGEWIEAAQRFRGAANTGADYWPLAVRQRLLLWSGIAYRQAGDEVNAELSWERTFNLLPGDWYALRAAALWGAPEPEIDAALNPGDWLAEQAGPEPEDRTLDLQHWQAAQQLRSAGFDDAADAHLDQWVADREGDAWALWEIAVQLSAAGEVSAAAAAATACLRAVGAEWWQAPAALVRIAYPTPWFDLVGRAAAGEGLDPLLLYSLIRRESLYDADARGLAGEIGLTQVIPLTGGDIAAALGEVHDHERLARPETAIRYGAWYLGAQLRSFDAAAEVALAAYNAGPGNAARWLEDAAAGSALTADAQVDAFLVAMDFSSTHMYVRSVIESWAVYRALAAAEAAGQ